MAKNPWNMTEDQLLVRAALCALDDFAFDGTLSDARKVYRFQYTIDRLKGDLLGLGASNGKEESST